jgi:MerR family transcriptional regulator/heat shock protein HspR
MQDRPVYPIGVVAEMLDLTPEAIRSWERAGVLSARRRSGKRFYSDLDVERLRFVKKLAGEGLKRRIHSYNLHD